MTQNEVKMNDEFAPQSGRLDKYFLAGHWVRWLARTLDILVASIIFSPIIFYIVNSMLSISDTPRYITLAYLITINGLGLIIVDSMIYIISGNSLGKALFRLKIE